jgi:hypothetical protein
MIFDFLIFAARFLTSIVIFDGTVDGSVVLVTKAMLNG